MGASVSRQHHIVRVSRGPDQGRDSYSHGPELSEDHGLPDRPTRDSAASVFSRRASTSYCSTLPDAVHPLHFAKRGIASADVRSGGFPPTTFGEMFERAAHKHEHETAMAIERTGTGERVEGGSSSPSAGNGENGLDAFISRPLSEWVQWTWVL